MRCADQGRALTLVTIGPFRIYRAPGSVAFLSCGSALQPILPKSQVWCVDEESSKFILQIRRPQYWRIELPIGDDEEVRWAQQLREVFDAILQFEKTECPFNRPFTVELPDRPETRYRPWTARRSSASLPLASITPEIARLHDGTSRGSICGGDFRTLFEMRRALNEHATSLLLPRRDSMSSESGLSVGGQGNDRASSSLFPGRVERPRSVSAVPPQRPLFMGGSLPKIREAAPPSDLTTEAPHFTSPTESLESIRGRESWLPTPLPPSPPLSTPGSPRSSSQQFQTPHVPRVADAAQSTLDQPVTFKSSQIWGAATTDSLSKSESSTATARSSIHEPDCPPASAQQQPADTTRPATATPTTPSPETPFKTASSTPVPTTPSPSSPSARGRRPPVRRATTTSSFSSPFSSPSSPHRALSPLPPAANLLTTRLHPPPRATAAASGPTAPAASPPPALQNTNALVAAVRRLPMTVLQRTCAILFSPPSYLIRLMLKVAARIMAGEWRGLVFGLGEGGERVSVAWDWSDDDGDDDEGGSGGGHGGGRGGGRGGDDFWLRGRTGPGRAKMVGAFPDSEDEEEDYGGDDYDGDDGGVGPLDKSVLASPGRRGRGRGRGGGATPGKKAGGRGVEQGTAAAAKAGGKQGKESDSESGVD